MNSDKFSKNKKNKFDEFFKTHKNKIIQQMEKKEAKEKIKDTISNE